MGRLKTLDEIFTEGVQVQITNGTPFMVYDHHPVVTRSSARYCGKCGHSIMFDPDTLAPYHTTDSREQRGCDPSDHDNGTIYCACGVAFASNVPDREHHAVGANHAIHYWVSKRVYNTLIREGTVDPIFYCYC